MPASFLSFVVVPTACAAAITFAVFRRFVQLGKMSTPFEGDISGLDPRTTVTLTGRVSQIEELIESPLPDTERVLAWSLVWTRGAPYPGKRLERWAPMALERSGGGKIHIRWLLDFDPRRSRPDLTIDEDELSDESIAHLRRQQRAAEVQGEEILSRIVPSRPEYVPTEADYLVPYVAEKGARYRTTLLRPGESITTVGSLEVLGTSDDGTPEVALRPDFIYPLAYRQSRSLLVGQGVFVLAATLGGALVLGIPLLIFWALRIS